VKLIATQGKAKTSETHIEFNQKEIKEGVLSKEHLAAMC
jgi:hypothetical protein